MLELRRAGAAACVAALTGAVAACGGNGSGGGDGDVVIGASISSTGALAQFAPLITSGYENAVQRVNAQGGLQVGETRRKVRLVLLDNRSDPNQAAAQIRALVNQKGAVALLGAATPPITIPQASTAEALRIPYVTSITPVGPWLAGSKSGWRYAWDFFFDPGNAVDVEFKTADLAKSNKKVALFTDNEADGKAWAQIVQAKAPAAGYSVVTHATFPVGTTNFRSFVSEAKAKGADIVIAQMVPPDGIALWKQMKALGFKPKVAFCEKCGDAGAFPKAVGPAANGTSTNGFWTSEQNLPGTSEAKATLGKKFDNDPDLSLAVASMTAADVLLDAIKAAGTTDAAKVNAAIARTDKTYTFAPIKFGKGNAAVTPSVMQQWQGGTAVQVYPVTDGARFQFPAEGLR
jgi:branched-chain amino acid transport system substrate-binding protein